MKVDEFEKKINYKFKNKDLINLAFTHSSFKSKKNKNYERLEFLGDRVLSLVISEDLFLKYPNENEGALSKRLSDLISKQKLIEVANEINIKEMLKIDQFEKRNLKLKKNISILSDVCESLIGAIYLDSNLENAKSFISKYWKKKISKNILPPQDPKSLLQEVSQKKMQKLQGCSLRLPIKIFCLFAGATAFSQYTARRGNQNMKNHYRR